MRWLLGLVLIAGCSAGGGYLPRRTDGGMDDMAQKQQNGDMAQSGGCANGIKDGNETDVDCGGGTCSPCSVDLHCLGPSDCTTASCVEGLCAPVTSCSNGLRDGNETDVDCGGPSCSPCANGRQCQQARDCSSFDCVNGFCSTASSCSDGIKNGNETDIDCGGGSCPACPNGATCSFSSDCQSFSCSNGLCCGAGLANCDGQSFNGCEVATSSDASNCGSCGNFCPQNAPICSNGGCQAGQQALVGQYDVNSGTAWSSNPPCYTCQEACAIRFGGIATSYSCSTQQNFVDHTAWASGYSDSTHCQGGTPVSESYKLGTSYDCGVMGCSFSAYVQDNCTSGTSINYCFH